MYLSNLDWLYGVPCDMFFPFNMFFLKLVLYTVNRPFSYVASDLLSLKCTFLGITSCESDLALGLLSLLYAGLEDVPSH